jgi:hypothetical protein
MLAAKPPEKHCCMDTSTAFQASGAIKPLRSIKPPNVVFAFNAAVRAAAAVAPIPVTVFVGSPVVGLSKALISKLFGLGSAVNTKEYWLGEGMAIGVYVFAAGFRELREIVSGRLSYLPATLL